MRGVCGCVWVCVTTPGQIACECVCTCVWVCVATPGQIACEGCVWVCVGLCYDSRTDSL